MPVAIDLPGSPLGGLSEFANETAAGSLGKPDTELAMNSSLIPPIVRRT
jgi:hypothetical protein